VTHVEKLDLEHPVGRQRPQHPPERVSIEAEPHREVRRDRDDGRRP